MADTRIRKRWLAAASILAVAAVGVAAGCGSSTGGNEDVSDRQIDVVTTTNFITDMAEEIGGDRVEVTGLMGPGVDPHLFKASASDVSTLRNADVIFYGGLELEGRMGDLLEELEKTTTTVAVTEAMPEEELRQPTEFEGKFDPHVWFDVPLWSSAVDVIADTYAEVDPEHAEEYRERADTYEAELEGLDVEVRETLAGIPEDQRVAKLPVGCQVRLSAAPATAAGIRDRPARGVQGDDPRLAARHQSPLHIRPQGKHAGVNSQVSRAAGPDGELHLFWK